MRERERERERERKNYNKLSLCISTLIDTLHHHHHYHHHHRHHHQQQQRKTAIIYRFYTSPNVQLLCIHQQFMIRLFRQICTCIIYIYNCRCIYQRHTFHTDTNGWIIIVDNNNYITKVTTIDTLNIPSRIFIPDLQSLPLCYIILY